MISFRASIAFLSVSPLLPKEGMGVVDFLPLARGAGGVLPFAFAVARFIERF
jgi:hypothetical protein